MNGSIPAGSKWRPFRGVDPGRLREARDFTAGVVPAHRILASARQQVETEDFVNAAVDAAVRILSDPGSAALPAAAALT